MSTLLLLAGSAMFLIAFWIYNKGVITGKNLPAFAAWAVFSLITFVNCLTYLSWTASFINIAVLLTDFVVCVGTTVAILIRLKGRVRLDNTDKLIMLISLVAVGIWVMFKAAAAGNLFNQAAYTITFLPIYRNALRNPRNEPTMPWFLWTIAFVLNLVALWLQPTTQAMDYVSPAVCLVHHAAITVLSLRK